MSSEHPLVSVLMVSYNSAAFIEEAIEGVLNQDYPNVELIICDDHSRDGSWQKVERFDDPRIVKVRNEKNLGEYANRSKAIEMARGAYSIFIDADDVIYPHGLSFMMDYAMAFPACDMIISRPWDERIIYPKTIDPRTFYQFEFLDLGICGINFTKVLFRSAALKNTDPFPPGVKLGDVYLQYRLALTHHSLVIPDASTWWRRNAGQASEKLLKDPCFYLQHELWIKLDMLKHPDCPLTTAEKAVAYENIYGSYLRTVVRSLARLRIKPVLALLRRYPVPIRYVPALWKKERRHYFSSYSGGHPMKEGSA